MRHKKRGRKLGRNSAHRKALGRNILRSLFEHGQIVTTIPKAKEYAPKAEKLITMAKRAESKIEKMEKEIKERARQEVTPELKQEISRNAEAIRLAHFRRALVKLPDKKIVQKIFYDIAPLYTKRKGGYTRVLHLSKPRLGDNGPQAVLALTEQLPEEDSVAKAREQRKADKDKLKKEKSEIKRKRKERKQKEKEKENLRRQKEQERMKREREIRKQAQKEKKGKRGKR